jgi:hypothetical protein
MNSFFLVLGFWHGVRGEFTDDVSETAVRLFSTGHEFIIIRILTHDQ